jgi:branched-chain amino acid transport system ATP-binding protein
MSLRVRGIHVRNGRDAALEDVSLEVEAGRVLAVLGPNGAGKSSLLRVIAGALRPTRGSITWLGRDVTGQAAHERARAGIALVPEGRRLFPHLTVEENLRLGGFRLSRARFAPARRRVLDLFPVLEERGPLPARVLSGGERQMLAIGRALVAGAQLLLLDEPSQGLAPGLADEVYAQLRLLREQGMMMILVEQGVGRALEIADEALVLRLGRVALRDTPEAVTAHPRLVAPGAPGLEQELLEYGKRWPACVEHERGRKA